MLKAFLSKLGKVFTFSYNLEDFWSQNGQGCRTLFMENMSLFACIWHVKRKENTLSRVNAPHRYPTRKKHIYLYRCMLHVKRNENTFSRVNAAHRFPTRNGNMYKVIQRAGTLFPTKLKNVVKIIFPRNISILKAVQIQKRLQGMVIGTYNKRIS